MRVGLILLATAAAVAIAMAGITIAVFTALVVQRCQPTAEVPKAMQAEYQRACEAGEDF